MTTPGGCAAAGVASSSRKRLANFAGRIFHHHIAHFRGQDIGRQVRSEAHTDIEWSIGLEGHRRSFGMQRLALPAVFTGRFCESISQRLCPKSPRQVIAIQLGSENFWQGGERKRRQRESTLVLLARP